MSLIVFIYTFPKNGFFKKIIFLRLKLEANCSSFCKKSVAIEEREDV